MTDCLILGDSIAVGVGQQRPECHVEARVGVSAAAFHVAQTSADTVIISLGSNDWSDPTSALWKLRERIDAKRVVWIVPAIRWAAQVHRVADLYGDTTVTVMAGFDGVHPTSYRALAQLTKENPDE